MAAVSVRDIPDAAWGAFRDAAHAEGITAEAKIRQYIVREARRQEMADATGSLGSLIGQAQWLRRHDGEFMHGSLTLRAALIQRDWEAVAILAPQQRNAMHGVSTLDSVDWEFMRLEAAKDGVEL